MPIHGFFDPAEGEPGVACVVLPQTAAADFLRVLLDHPAVDSFRVALNPTEGGRRRLGAEGVSGNSPRTADETANLVRRLEEVLAPSAKLDSPEAREILDDFGDIHGWLRKRQEADGLAGLGTLELTVAWKEPSALDEDEDARFAAAMEASGLDAEALLGACEEAGESTVVWDLGDMGKLSTKAFLLVSQDMSDVPFDPSCALVDFQGVSPAALALLEWAVAEIVGGSACVYVVSAG